MLARYLNHKEDSLTAGVFGYLLHLPVSLFWPILRAACHEGERLPEDPGEPTQIDPWPLWDPKGTSNTERVIPDYFLRFAEFDLIVEAKRWDSGQQSEGQWKTELIAYANEYGGEDKAVWMLAVGGLWQTLSCPLQHSWKVEGEGGADMREIHCRVLMCDWRRLLQQVLLAGRALSAATNPALHDAAHERVLADLVDLFERHGYWAGRWFADLAFDRNLLTPLPGPDHAALHFHRHADA